MTNEASAWRRLGGWMLLAGVVACLGVVANGILTPLGADGNDNFCRTIEMTEAAHLVLESELTDERLSYERTLLPYGIRCSYQSDRGVVSSFRDFGTVFGVSSAVISLVGLALLVAPRRIYASLR